MYIKKRDYIIAILIIVFGIAAVASAIIYNHMIGGKLSSEVKESLSGKSPYSYSTDEDIYEQQSIDIDDRAYDCDPDALAHIGDNNRDLREEKDAEEMRRRLADHPGLWENYFEDESIRTSALHRILSDDMRYIIRCYADKYTQTHPNFIGSCDAFRNEMEQSIEEIIHNDYYSQFIPKISTSEIDLSNIENFECTSNAGAIKILTRNRGKDTQSHSNWFGNFKGSQNIQYDNCDVVYILPAAIANPGEFPNPGYPNITGSSPWLGDDGYDTDAYEVLKCTTNQ